MFLSFLVMTIFPLHPELLNPHWGECFIWVHTYTHILFPGHIYINRGKHQNMIYDALSLQRAELNLHFTTQMK